MSDDFIDLIRAAPVIEMREPLAGFLGAFRPGGGTLSYSFADAVKLAGHCCPTVTGAFLATRAALARLYGEEIPVRGEIAVSALGEPGEGVYGVMSQVISYITGAAPQTGFKGLGRRFRRQGLLSFDGGSGDEAVTFLFERREDGRRVRVRLFPWLVPFPAEKAARTAVLMEKVMTGDATDAEAEEFRGLWMEKIDGMLRSPDTSAWLKIEEE